MAGDNIYKYGGCRGPGLDDGTRAIKNRQHQHAYRHYGCYRFVRNTAGFLSLAGDQFPDPRRGGQPYDRQLTIGSPPPFRYFFFFAAFFLAFFLAMMSSCWVVGWTDGSGRQPTAGTALELHDHDPRRKIMTVGRHFRLGQVWGGKKGH